MRVIKTVRSESGYHAVSVRYCSAWVEYRCVPLVGGEPKPDETYFTDDKADALQTADTMLAAMPEKYPELTLQPK